MHFYASFLFYPLFWSNCVRSSVQSTPCPLSKFVSSALADQSNVWISPISLSKKLLYFGSPKASSVACLRTIFAFANRTDLQFHLSFPCFTSNLCLFAKVNQEKVVCSIDSCGTLAVKPPFVPVIFMISTFRTCLQRSDLELTASQRGSCISFSRPFYGFGSLLPNAPSSYSRDLLCQTFTFHQILASFVPFSPIAIWKASPFSLETWNAQFFLTNDLHPLLDLKIQHFRPFVLVNYYTRS